MKTVSLILCVLCIGSIVDAGFKYKSINFADDEKELSPRIIRGKDAKDGQFPYQVSLRRRMNGQHFCGASIISTRFLLTAAHCTQGNAAVPFLVYAVVGSVDRRTGVSLTLNKITPHEKYDGDRLLNDISLIRTASEIIFSATIQPIALPTQNLPQPNTVVVTSGWGRISMSSPNQAPVILQFAEPRTISLTNCIERFKELDMGYENNLHEHNLCTINEKGVSVCNGDSGGPLAYDSGTRTKTLIGIVSWSASGCGNSTPDVFTRVYSFVEWIQKQMEM